MGNEQPAMTIFNGRRHPGIFKQVDSTCSGE